VPTRSTRQTRQDARAASTPTRPTRLPPGAHRGSREATLRKRLLGNKLRAEETGDPFRSFGAVVRFSPPQGSIADRKRAQNLRFSPADRVELASSIETLLEVSWATLAQRSLDVVEVELISEEMPLREASARRQLAK
jgi:hypothetical protein